MGNEIGSNQSIKWVENKSLSKQKNKEKAITNLDIVENSSNRNIENKGIKKDISFEMEI